MENSVKVAFAPISVDEIQDSFKKGLKQAQLRQVVTTSYPSAKLSNDMQDSLFDADELGVTTTDYKEERIAWREVGETMTAEDVANQLAKFPDAMIYKVLSHEPILTADQKRVISNGLSGAAFEDFKAKNELEKEEWDAECSKIVYDSIAERQIVRYGEDNKDGKDADAAVLFNGKVQYRQTYFSKTFRADIDLRTKEEDKQEIPAIELAVTKETVTA